MMIPNTCPCSRMIAPSTVMSISLFQSSRLNSLAGFVQGGTVTKEKVNE